MAWLFLYLWEDSALDLALQSKHTWLSACAPADHLRLINSDQCARAAEPQLLLSPRALLYLCFHSTHTSTSARLLFAHTKTPLALSAHLFASLIKRRQTTHGVATCRNKNRTPSTIRLITIPRLSKKQIKFFLFITRYFWSPIIPQIETWPFWFKTAIFFMAPGMN